MVNNEPTHITDIAMLSGGYEVIRHEEYVESYRDGAAFCSETWFVEVGQSESVEEIKWSVIPSIRPPRSLFGRMVEWVKAKFKI